MSARTIAQGLTSCPEYGYGDSANFIGIPPEGVCLQDLVTVRLPGSLVDPGITTPKQLLSYFS